MAREAASASVQGDLLRQAVEGMERPLVVLDDQWRILYVNPAGARMLDRTPASLLGRQIWAQFPGSVGGPFERLCRAVRGSGRPDGVEAWSALLGRWLRADAFLTDAGLVLSYDDITERRRAEEELVAAVAAREEAAAEAARAAREAEETGRHLMLLGDISQEMTSTLDTDEAASRFAATVVPLLADWCLVSVVDPDGTRRDVGRAHRDPAMQEAMHRYADARVASNDASAPVPVALRHAEPVVIAQLTDQHLETMIRDDESRAALAPLAPTAVATFPLIARGEVFGAFTLVNGVDRGPHTPVELRTAEIASRRAALALDNARLVTLNHQVAERLQLSLLSPPVQPDNLELAVRYRPATRGVSIGGDWYDAFLQPDGDTVLVIGDVMGHDVAAAAAMGQIKTLVRAIAFDRLEEPAGLLNRVDNALVGLAVPAMATALVCRIEQGEAERAAGVRCLHWASAGHPDPLLLLADGEVRDLAVRVGPPLGSGWVDHLADGVALLPDDSTLLLFTDGLFERRGELLDDGRERLRALLARSAGLSLGALCDRLLEGMLGPGVEDDVAVLAVRAHPADRPRPAEAGPEVLPALVGPPP
jgi:PAS domain S-box-containing protein